MSEIRILWLISTAAALVIASAAQAQDDPTDREQRRAEIREQYDANGDGVLSVDERRALHDARDGRQRGKKKRRLEHFDTDGDGQLSESERTAAREVRRERRARALERFDADGDGQLSGSEIGAARSARGGRGHRGGRGNSGDF